MTDLADFAGGGFQTIVQEGVWEIGPFGGSTSGVLNIPQVDLNNTYLEVRWIINGSGLVMPAIWLKNSTQIEWKSSTNISSNGGEIVHYKLIQDTEITSIYRDAVSNNNYRDISSDPIGITGQFANQITIPATQSGAIVKCGLHYANISAFKSFSDAWSCTAEGWLLNSTTLLVPHHTNAGDRIVSYQILNY